MHAGRVYSPDNATAFRDCNNHLSHEHYNVEQVMRKPNDYVFSEVRSSALLCDAPKLIKGGQGLLL